VCLDGDAKGRVVERASLLMWLALLDDGRVNPLGDILSDSEPAYRFREATQNLKR
jgi:hypothetical protein